MLRAYRPSVRMPGSCASTFLGGQLGERQGSRGLRRVAGYLKNFVSHIRMFKYAVFDIKPTYDRQFFDPDAQLHSTIFRLGQVRGTDI